MASTAEETEGGDDDKWRVLSLAPFTKDAYAVAIRKPEIGQDQTEMGTLSCAESISDGSGCFNSVALAFEDGA